MRIDFKNIKFARFGGLSSVKQKGYNINMEGYHSPPSRRGIYAFLYPYYEPFLLGADEYSGINTKHSKFERVKNKDGEYIISKDDVDVDEKNWMKFYSIRKYKDGNSYIIKPKVPKIFKYNGELWHHLGDFVKFSDILDTKGTWVLTSFNIYISALKKEHHNSINSLKKMNINTKNPHYYTNIDHLEVFIEKIN